MYCSSGIPHLIRQQYFRRWALFNAVVMVKAIFIVFHVVEDWIPQNTLLILHKLFFNWKRLKRKVAQRTQFQFRISIWPLSIIQLGFRSPQRVWNDVQLCALYNAKICFILPQVHQRCGYLRLLQFRLSDSRTFIWQTHLLRYLSHAQPPHRLL